MDKYINQYLEYKKTHITYYKSYRSVLQRFNRGVKKELLEITNEDIDQFQQKLAKRLQPATVAYSAHIIAGFYRYWCRRISLPVFPEEIRAPVVPEFECQYLTYHEMDAIEATCEDSYLGLRKLVIFRLLRDTAARISEVITLRIDQVEQTMCAQVMTKKARKMKILVWTPGTHKSLMKYLGIRICLNQRPFLFEERRGKPLASRTVQRWLREAAKEAGITKRVHPHMYRHTGAFKLIKDGKGIFEVQQKLGHSNLNSSLKYLRLGVQNFLDIVR